MISFDEYMGFSEKDKEKKPSKIKQFFKKHGKKLAIGAAIAAGAVGAGIGGKKLWDMHTLKKATKAARPDLRGPHVTPNGKINEYDPKTGVPKKTLGAQGYKSNSFEDSDGAIIANTTNLTNEQARDLHENWLTKQKSKARANQSVRSDIMKKADSIFGKKYSDAKAKYVQKHMAKAGM